MKRTLIFSAVMLALLILLTQAYADTVYLKNGRTVKGAICGDTDEYVLVEQDYGRVKLYKDRIDRIEPDAGVVEAHDDAMVEPSGDIKKPSLVMVGDATLTYANYSFELPPNWAPLMSDPELTDRMGYWHGEHKDGQVLIEIQPFGKLGKSLDDFVNLFKESYYEKEELPLDALKEYLSFKPLINYLCKVYSVANLKKGTYELFVFAELPENVVSFALTGMGQDEKCITSYVEDFSKVITSFKWLLGREY